MPRLLCHILHYGSDTEIQKKWKLKLLPYIQCRLFLNQKSSTCFGFSMFKLAAGGMVLHWWSAVMGREQIMNLKNKWTNKQKNPNTTGNNLRIKGKCFILFSLSASIYILQTDERITKRKTFRFWISTRYIWLWYYLIWK